MPSCRVLTLFLIVVTPFVACAEPAKPEATLRARAILRKYCIECHDADNKPRGEILVNDRAGLDRPARPFLTPGAAEASQLVRLVEDGSMPPGTRDKPTAEERQILKDWITADASPFPRRFDDTYVQGTILADLESRVKADDRQYVRYFSLHNLMPDDAVPNLAAPRQSLLQAIADLSKRQAPAAESVDPYQLVYRVDLRKTGWSMTPFTGVVKVEGKQRAVPSNVNLFDVILIEYPFASLDPNSKLVDRFLKPAGQVLPVTYLRGDWFADAFANSPVAKEVCDVLDVRAPAKRPPLSDKPPAPIRQPGVAIVPLDAVTRPDIAPPAAELEFTFETGNPPAKNPDGPFVPTNQFKIDDRMWIRFKPNKQVFIEIVWTDESGKASFVELGSHQLVAANQQKLLFDEKFGGYRVGSDAGTQKLTIFVSESEFPRGELLNTKEHMNERVIHPFYTLPGVETKYEFDPAKISKKTIEFTIKPK